MIRNTANNKIFLYYELAIANPVKGRMGIPINSTVSERQSLPVVLVQICRNIFGYSRIIQHPRMIVSDNSMFFMLAALTEFNSETIHTYLERAYN